MSLFSQFNFYKALLMLLLALCLPLKFAFAETKEIAKLQWLDKVTARVSDLQVRTGESVLLGPLTIKLHHCDRTPPEQIPESTAFLEIIEQQQGEESTALFSGWMFASSPTVHALEHPVYDIILIECADKQNG